MLVFHGWTWLVMQQHHTAGLLATGETYGKLKLQFLLRLILEEEVRRSVVRPIGSNGNCELRQSRAIASLPQAVFNPSLNIGQEGC